MALVESGRLLFACVVFVPPDCVLLLLFSSPLISGGLVVHVAVGVFSLV
jgi:hypothetical protein